MVRDRRQKVCQPLDRADFLPNGPFNRSSPAEPPCHPHAGLHVLLQDARGQALHTLGDRQDIPGVRSNPGPRPVRNHPACTEVRGLFRPLLRERPRTAFQFRSSLLHAGSPGSLLLGTLQDLRQGEGVLEHRPAVLHDHHHRILDLQHRDHPLICKDSDQRVPA